MSPAPGQEIQSWGGNPGPGLSAGRQNSSYDPIAWMRKGRPRDGQSTRHDIGRFYFYLPWGLRPRADLLLCLSTANGHCQEPLSRRGHSRALECQVRALLLGLWTSTHASLDPGASSAGRDSLHLPCSWLKTQREGIGKYLDTPWSASLWTLPLLLMPVWGRSNLGAPFLRVQDGSREHGTGPASPAQPGLS